MAKLLAFNFMSLNGCFKGPGGDISWSKGNDPEKTAHALEGLKSGGTLIFGRVTYEMMAGFWPSPDAMKYAPAMAEGMNKADKIVFSRTLKKAEWNNTRLVKDDMAGEIKRLKQAPGKDMAIMGSGSIITQLAEQGLIDEYQLMIDPIVISGGTPVFHNIGRRLDLELIQVETFKSGVVVLSYRPAGR